MNKINMRMKSVSYKLRKTNEKTRNRRKNNPSNRVIFEVLRMREVNTLPNTVMLDAGK